MKIVHVFRSGNDCVVNIPDRIADGQANIFDAAFERWPPSREDQEEWINEVYPNKVVPALDAVARKNLGPGRTVEVVPGVRTWVRGELQ
jgi:hypothetical protein